MLKQKSSQNLIESFSGIRGVYGQSINEQLVQKYALAYFKLFKKRDCLVIGGDSRLSTSVLKKAFIKAFSQCAVKKIIDVGTVPVQVCEYAVIKFKAQGGVYITASHNEPEYNGWKFLKEDGALLTSKQSERLIRLAHSIIARSEQSERAYSAEVAWTTKAGRNKLAFFNLKKQKIAIDNYINFILQRIGRKSINQIKKAKFKILADPNGGSAIAVLSKLFKKLEAEAKIINNKSGKFNRLIEPNEASLAYLAPALQTGHFAFACGFDCDADRVELVLPSHSQFAKNTGSTVISGNYVLALACEAILAGTNGQIVVINDATSCLIRDIIKKHQAQIKESEAGEMSVVEKMEKYKSLVGGEGSNGGVIIPRIKCRDGIMTVVLILKMMAQSRKSLSEILESYPRYFSQRAKLTCSPAQSIKIKNKVESYYKAKGFKIKKTGGKNGGLKIYFDPNSFLWLRQSKTEANVLRLIADGDDHGKVKKILGEAKKLWTKYC